MTSENDIKQRLDRAAQLVSLRPDFGRRRYTANASLLDGLQCNVREKSHEFIADVPAGMGGGGTAPSPMSLLRGAMASCVAIGIRSWAARRCLSLQSVNVSFTTEVDSRGQLGVADWVSPGFDAGFLQIQVKTQHDPQDVRAAIAASLRYSPLMAAVSGRKPLEVSIEVAGAEDTDS